MKTKRSELPKQSKPTVQLKDMVLEKAPKGGTDSNTIYVTTAGGGSLEDERWRQNSVKKKLPNGGTQRSRVTCLTVTFSTQT